MWVIDCWGSVGFPRRIVCLCDVGCGVLGALCGQMGVCSMGCMGSWEVWMNCGDVWCVYVVVCGAKSLGVVVFCVWGTQ